MCKNHISSTTFLCCLLFYIILIPCSLFAQDCVPPAANTCEKANILCSLESVSGYKCKNTDQPNDTACKPLCPSGGIANNISWWAFVTNGGNITINIDVSNCSITGTGVQLGIWADCNCVDTVICNISCQSQTSISIQANLIPCKKYYFFVDGCTGDVCDFVLTTSGGTSPKVDSIRRIIGIDTLCPSSCANNYFVDSDTSVCKPTYTWTIDGVEVQKDTSRKLTYAFLNQGSFLMCVTGALDNIGAAGSCGAFGPVCKTIFVENLPIHRGPTVILCSEDVPYQWHSHTILNSGVYTERFTLNCCDYDSIRTFQVLPPPTKEDIFYLGCRDGDNQYNDSINKVTYSSCQDGIDIIYRNRTSDGCDSSIRLFFTYLDMDATIKEYCEGGKSFVEINAIDKTCSVQNFSSLGFEYSWVKQSSGNTILGTNSKLEISGNDQYCVDVILTGNLNTITRKCTVRICEDLNEDLLQPKMVCPKGDLELCRGETGQYSSDTIFPNNVRHIWTITNGSIVSGNGTATINVLWDFDPGAGIPFIGKICYYYESDCPVSPECCIEVNVQPFPAPDAGPDKSVCGLVNSLDGNASSEIMWRQISGPSASIILPANVSKPTVTVTSFGSYTYELEETRFGCTAKDTVTLNFYDSPQSSNISFTCNPAQTSFVMKTDIVKGSPPYRIVKGNGMIINGSTYMSLQINNNVQDTVQIVDNNNCIVEIIYTHECNCSNEIGKISTLLQKVCEDQLVKIIYDNSNEKLDQNPNRDTVVYFTYSNPGNPLGSIIEFLNSSSFGYDPKYVYGVTYFIGARLGRADGNGGIDNGKGCIKTSFGTPFVFVQYPNPLAGRDTAICGTSFLLDGFQSLPGTSVMWKVLGGRAAKISSPNLSSTLVEPLSGYGDYVFEFTEINDNLCSKTDQLTITFNENPNLSNLFKFCTELGSSSTNPGKFQASIELNGGKPPYVLVTPPSTNNGSINGNLWMSNDIVSLDSFIIQIMDANGCVSSVLRNSHNCNCGTISPGRLDSNLIRVCQDQCVAILSIVPEMIDPSIETTMYVVHKFPYTDPSKVIDTIYSLSDSICFDPNTMKLGANNPIFVTRIVGDDKNSDGIVDKDDSCSLASNDLKIIFDEYPTAFAGIDDTICGLTSTLNGILNFGNASWRLVSGGGNPVLANPNQVSTQVTVPQAGVYIFELVGDNFNCKSSDEVRLLFVNSPKFDSTSVIYDCDNIAENYRVRIRGLFGDRKSWNLTGVSCNGLKILGGQFLPNSDIWESDLIPSGCNFTLSLKDQFDCSTDIYSGVHICKCLSKIDDIDLSPVNLCEDQSITIVYPKLPDTSNLDGNDVVRFILYEGLSSDPKNGTIINENSTGKFSFQAPMIFGKTYFISVFVGNLNATSGGIDLNDRCLVFTPGKPVTWYKYPQAVITGDSLLTCAITKISLDAGASVSGSGDPLQYHWNNNDRSQSIDVIVNGTYTVTVTDPRTGCTNSLSFIVNRKVDLPRIQIDTPSKLTCDINTVTLNGNRSDSGNDFRVLWSGPGIVSGANSYSSVVDQIGNYKFLIENIRTGCRDSVNIFVNEDKQAPIADISQIGKLGCVVKQIKLDGSGSRSSSGSNTISTFIWTGNILSGQGTSQISIPSPGGRYILEIKDPMNGCIDRDTIDITEDDNPFAFIVLDSVNPKCFGQNNGNITITNIIDKNGVSILNQSDLEFSINGGPFTKNTDFSNLPKGSYTITVRDSKGCVLNTSTVLVEPGPIDIKVKSVSVDQNSIVNIDSLLLEVLGGTVNQFGEYKDTLWFNVRDSIYISNLDILADTSKEFIVEVIDQSGCKVQKTIRIIVRIIKDVWWPTIINPYSGLGENNRFNLYGKKVRNIKLLQIFSRWGELVYSNSNFNDANTQRGLGWNGFYNGEYALPGVYAFYAEVEFEGSTGSTVVKGDFTLVR
ncbi:MAG: hypothetical protein IT267_04605 [Saprospiraceae bacterium]|nr:hypothetical protein [Saprospiraceae bacterium]